MSAQPTDLHQEVWQFLLDNFAGAENATPRAAIIQRFNLIKRRELSDRMFRKVVSDLVTEQRKPICTLSNAGTKARAEAGYFVARTGTELDAAAADLESRGSQCFARARVLRACEPLEKQDELF